MAHVIDFPRDFRAQVERLPHPVRQDLETALLEASLDPYLLPALIDSAPHLRILEFSDRGTCLLVVDDITERVLVDQLVWRG
ncbi:hypothetical protein [Streptomyces sp. NPDC001380]|uniref:hypothetical protein n=1 Tax=Streptomyces sp. NPDC001380 TaxID=3364566 RepID=UPI0036893304